MKSSLSGQFCQDMPSSPTLFIPFPTTSRGREAALSDCLASHCNEGQWHRLPSCLNEEVSGGKILKTAEQAVESLYLHLYLHTVSNLQLPKMIKCPFQFKIRYLKEKKKSEQWERDVLYADNIISST